MYTHIKVVGALNIVLGAFGLLIAAAMMLIFGGATWLVGATGDPDAAMAVPILGLTGAALSTFLLVLSLLFFGGPVLRPLSLALTIGVISGTYSTVYIASALLVYLQEHRAAAAARGSRTPARAQRS